MFPHVHRQETFVAATKCFCKSSEIFFCLSNAKNGSATNVSSARKRGNIVRNNVPATFSSFICGDLKGARALTNYQNGIAVRIRCDSLFQ